MSSDSAGFYSNVFLVHKASRGWHPVIDLKQLNALISLSYYKLSAEYRKKRRLRVQNRYAGCVLSHTNPSSKQEVPTFCIRKQAFQFQVFPFGLNTAPQVFTCLGHTVAAYLHRQGISVIPYLDDWLIHHPDYQVLGCHLSQLLKTLDLVGLKLNEGKSELDRVQDIQCLGHRLCLDQGRVSLPESKAVQFCHIHKCPSSWGH